MNDPRFLRNYSKYPYCKNETSEMMQIKPEIEKLLQKKVILRSSIEQHQYVSPIFLRKKPDGSNRLILNLKSLNKHLEYNHFKMTTLHTVLNLQTKLFHDIYRSKRCILLHTYAPKLYQIPKI